MDSRTLCGISLTVVAPIVSIAAPATPSAKKPDLPVTPPSMSKLSEAPVFAPLPDGRVMGIFLGSAANGPAALARYSSDGGRTWNKQPETTNPPKNCSG